MLHAISSNKINVISFRCFHVTISYSAFPLKNNICIKKLNYKKIEINLALHFIKLVLNNKINFYLILNAFLNTYIVLLVLFSNFIMISVVQFACFLQSSYY